MSSSGAEVIFPHLCILLASNIVGLQSTSVELKKFFLQNHADREPSFEHTWHLLSAQVTNVLYNVLCCFYIF